MVLLYTTKKLYGRVYKLAFVIMASSVMSKSTEGLPLNSVDFAVNAGRWATVDCVALNRLPLWSAQVATKPPELVIPALDFSQRKRLLFIPPGALTLMVYPNLIFAPEFKVSPEKI